MLAANGGLREGETPAGDRRHGGLAHPVPIAGVLIAATQTQPDHPVCFQGGPWEDDLHHYVHQRELAPVPTSSFCVPIPL